jgi:hypothetical protein
VFHFYFWSQASTTDAPNELLVNRKTQRLRFPATKSCGGLLGRSFFVLADGREL